MNPLETVKLEIPVDDSALSIDYVTSDLHLSHVNISKLANRPFDDPDVMNADIVAKWNREIAEHDNVLVLGDVAMGKIAQSLPIVKLLHGHKFLIPGNHDRCWSGHHKTGDWPERYLDAGFERILPNQVQGCIGQDAVTLCHFPYRGDSTGEERYVEFRPQDCGQFLLHGHLHGAYSRKGNMIDVGIDAWGGWPVSIAIIRTYMIAGSGNCPRTQWMPSEENCPRFSNSQWYKDWKSLRDEGETT